MTTRVILTLTENTTTINQKRSFSGINKERVQEIIKSPEEIRVVHQENPVWIEQLENDDLALVRNLETGERMDVPVAELVEQPALVNPFTQVY